MRELRLLETALAGRAFSRAEIRAMTMPEIESFVSILSGKPGPSGTGRRMVPVRRKGR
ncbi:MAG: hypothetical protein FD177_102 [Desulfovibrionaceae bacterium]|nr:MAG: hypothetical protein FD177_102 [Desulfovibrionaceae bacterium]